jgi:hypothetical protein
MMKRLNLLLVERAKELKIMTFPPIAQAKNLFFPFPLNNAMNKQSFIAVQICFLLLCPTLLQAEATLEIGRETEILQMQVDTPNLNKATTNGEWKVSPGTVDYVPPVDTTVTSEDEAMFTPPEHVLVKPDSRQSNPTVQKEKLEVVMDNGETTIATTPPATTDPVGVSKGNLAIAGKNGGSRTAIADGKVSLKPYLTTYNNASYTVHLYDETGKEISYAGKPLFTWNRSDDKSANPAIFQGKPISNSMTKNGDDWSPVKGLEFNFDIKKGQKVVVKAAGNPTTDAYVKLNSSAF